MSLRYSLIQNKFFSVQCPVMKGGFWRILNLHLKSEDKLKKEEFRPDHYGGFWTRSSRGLRTAKNPPNPLLIK